MDIFRRRSRVKLGSYKPGPVSPIAPIERVVEEGVMISASAVRMVIKNRLIVAAVRDELGYDSELLVAAAREQFLTLAGENEATADRLDPPLAVGEVAAADGPDAPEVDDREEHRRGPEVFRLLAAALRLEASEHHHLVALVDCARDDAWQEVGRAILARLTSAESRPAAEPDYERNRRKRMRQLVQVDLASLDRNRAAR